MLGITAGLALLTAPPVKAAVPTCEEPPLASKALQDQFRDIAPGVPYQAGVPPVTDKDRPQGEAAILRMVEDEMGFIRGDGAAETLHGINRLRYGGCGQIVEEGHTYEVTQYTYGVSLHEDAAREDIEATGPQGKIRLIRVVRGNEAWDESTPGVGTHSADKLARQRQLQLGRTPFGIVNAITNLNPTQIKVHDTGSGAVTLKLPVDGVSTTVVLDRNYRPATVTQRVGHHRIVDQYSDYHDVNQYGLMIPRHIVETIDGHPHEALHIIRSELADYEVFPAPAFEAPFPPPSPSDNHEFIGGGFGVPAVDVAAGTTPQIDGHPDLSGFWGARRANLRGPGSNNPDQLNFPARHGIFSNFENDYFLLGQQGEDIPLYKPQYWSQIHYNQAHAATLDPYLQCTEVTPPRLGPPVRIVETSRDFLMFFNGAVGTPNTYRDIPAGPVFVKPDPDGTAQGDPASHWDGDTLVVDTVGYDGQTWLSRAGYPGSYNLETIERLHRQGDRMSYDVTVKDPDYLQRPWVLPTEYVYLLPSAHRFSTRGGPYMCVGPIPEVGATLG
ncbi:MAG TPA: hypothetical protein VMF64_04300 [Steroidobacteraceae bacterium]|nr:hypothetical protein [Steroidobacteraceae bacterium]